MARETPEEEAARREMSGTISQTGIVYIEQNRTAGRAANVFTASLALAITAANMLPPDMKRLLMDEAARQIAAER